MTDTVYIAGTGSGKTTVIAMMLLHDPRCIAVTVSPLIELQQGQVRCSLLLAQILIVSS